MTTVTIAPRYSRQAEFLPIAREAARVHAVPLSLVMAIIGVESAFNPRAVNQNDPGWAWGLMQMIPTTARGLGYNGPMESLLDNPRLAVDLGAKLLAENLRRTGGAVADSVSAYNGGFRPALGFGSRRADGTFANAAYVNKVLETQRYFQGWLSGESDRSSPPRAVPIVILILALLLGVLAWPR